ncbi:sigma factor-like helix-turn-helix DNA-binding protein [Mycoplasma sp. 128]|uniref:sigma factor-like helix-turn-helix DNA-binding protein n=1 Tax=Mycoplasma sp. 3341 TaxID=3447506 RepID=UPI003F65E921
MSKIDDKDLEEREYLVELFEKYQQLLPTSQRQALYLHLIEDLSFSEMSEELAMTRSGAFDAVKKGKKKLLEIAKKLEQNP